MTPSVEDVIERLNEAQTEYEERSRLGAWCFMDGDSSLLKDTAALLDLLRWRDVSELPVLGVAVTIRTKEGLTIQGWWLDHYSPTDDRLFWYSGKQSIFEVESRPLTDVTHWLPIVPTGDSNE